MILNALDEILFWNEISLLKEFTCDIVSKYYPSDAKKCLEEKDHFIAERIPNMADFIKRMEMYIADGRPVWVSGRNQLSDDITQNDLEKAILISSTIQRGKYLADTAYEIIAKKPKFWDFYTSNVLYANKNKVCELTIGAGLGTTAVMRAMKDSDLYVGVDIDFICAKQADAIAKHFQVNGLGIATSLWNMPFENGMFTTVCCNQGLEECREIDVIVKEASRVLDDSGRIVLRCKQKNSPRYFGKYGFTADETQYWLRKLRLYSDVEQVQEIASKNELQLIDKKDDGIWSVLVFEKY